MLEKLHREIDLNKIKYSISVKNLKTNETYNYNENMRASSASTIKLLIMAEVMNQVNKGILSLKQRIEIKEENRIEGSILSMLDKANTYSQCLPGRQRVTIMLEKL